MFNLHDILRFCEVLASLSIHLQSRITIEVWINIVDNRLLFAGLCLPLSLWELTDGLVKRTARTADQFTFIFTSVALLCGARQTEDLIIICFVLCVRQAKQWQHPPSNKPSWSVVYWLLLGIGRVIIHYLGPRVPFQKRVSRRLLSVWRDIYVIYDVLSGLRW